MIDIWRRSDIQVKEHSDAGLNRSDKNLLGHLEQLLSPGTSVAAKYRAIAMLYNNRLWVGKTNKTLIKASIIKWEYVKRTENDNTLPKMMRGTTSCPLCHEHLIEDRASRKNPLFRFEACKTCPVFKHTGISGCKNTGYPNPGEMLKTLQGVKKSEKQARKKKESVKEVLQKWKDGTATSDDPRHPTLDTIL